MKQGSDYQALKRTIASKQFGLLVLAVLILSALSPLIAASFLCICYLDSSGTALYIFTGLASILLSIRVRLSYKHIRRQRAEYRESHQPPAMPIRDTLLSLTSLYIAISGWLASAVCHILIAGHVLSVSESIVSLLKHCYSL